MWPWDRQEKQLEKLVAEADAAFEIPDYDQVLPLADRIIALGHMYGFELKARALAGLDREPEALAVMERAVELEPEEGSLWAYLGEYRSNAGDLAGAHDAFRRAGRLEPDLREESMVNDALVYLREEDPVAALARLDLVGIPASPVIRALASRTRSWALLLLARYEEVVELCSREIGTLQAVGEIEGPNARELEHSLGMLLTSKAEALWRGRGDRSAAIELCCTAAQWMKKAVDHFVLVREIEKLDAGQAKALQLVCAGSAMLPEFDSDLNPTNSEKLQRVPYAISYVVLADRPEEGLEFARRFEPVAWRASLELRSAVPSPHELKDGRGVYYCSGRVFARA